MYQSIFGVVAGLFLSCGILFAAENENKPLVIGTTSGYAPFVSLNTVGDYEGFDIDLANELGKKLSRPVIFKDYGNMTGLMIALKQQKIDALIWAVSITEERTAKWEMIHYQGAPQTEVPFVFWGEIPSGITKISDLASLQKPLCVEAGTYQEAIVKTATTSLKYFDGIQDVILDLKSGRSVASTIDPALVSKFQKKYPQLKVLSLPLPQAMQCQGNGICLRKENSTLAREVKQAVELLKQEGVISKLEKKWGLE